MKLISPSDLIGHQDTIGKNERGVILLTTEHCSNWPTLKVRRRA